MIVLVIVCLAFAVVLSLTEMRRLHDGHVLRGLFGQPALDDLVVRWADRAAQAAERLGRLDDFERILRDRAWNGTPVQIDPGRGEWSSWSFTDGEVWEVRHDRPPRRPIRRVIIGGAEAIAGDTLAVRTYVPRSHELTLAVVDVRPRA